ncbi:CD109 antigen [Chanos chanos]|uniref:CD109 antigen n=1 Tax=Chanos chanos TaxID=29144 RepID=A0A6J2V398_CHACN|nr:CD109 antigen-like [Chanos chanos]
MEWLQVFGVFGFFAIYSGAQTLESPSHSPSYLISVSKVLRPGIPTTLSVTNLKASAVLVISEIIHGNTSVVRTKSTIEGGSTEMQVLSAVPENDMSYWYPYELLVKGYVGNQMVFTNTTFLRFSPKSVSILIQTDKPNYKPGQAVKIRAVIIQPDSKPHEGQMDLVIRDPRGNMIRQWMSLDSVLGVVSKEFQLSENPPLGMWTIVSTVNEVVQEKQFNVDYYVLPKFEVLVQAPSILHYEETLRGTVTARYFYGKSVSGHVKLTYVHCFHGIDVHYEDSKMIYGSTDFIFDVPELFNDIYERSVDQMYQYYAGYMDSEYVDIIASVTESLTGLTYNSSIRVSVVKCKYNLEFRQYPSVIKPSLNFSAEVRVASYNGQPLTAADQMKSVSLSVSQHRRSPWSWKWDEEGALQPRMHNSSTTDASMSLTNMRPFPAMNDEIPVQELVLPVPANGVVPFHIQLSENVATLSIEAHFEDSSERLQLYSSYSSPSQSYIQLNYTSTPQVGHPLHLTVESSFLLTEFHYLVMSRGQVVAAGTMRSTSFTLTPDQSWVPKSCVLVYCVRPDGEIINDALHIPFTQALRNHVSLSWSHGTAQPADGVSLSVSVSEPGSLVGIMVVDKATKSSGTDNDITEKRVIEELVEYSEYMSHPVPDGMRMGDPYSIFTECNLMVLTDARLNIEENLLAPEFREGVEITQYEGYSNQEPHERKNFPETWLWLNLNMGSSNTTVLPLMVPDSMTSWVATAFVMSENLGLGVSAPAELTVFQDFFLSLNLPAYIIRGELLLLEIILFNYMEEDLEVMVIVGESEMFEFVSSESEAISMASTQRVSVWSQNGTSVLFPIRATELGEMPISVRAISSYGSDVVRGSILVKPEGIEQTFTKTLFLEFAPTQSLLTEEILFTFPADVVPGSQRAEVTAIGDILGPSITGLESLIQMPYGCGEQNMIHFAPNIYILRYLTSTGQATEEIRNKAVTYMMEGYERELSYQRLDGSFSAFGDDDLSGSTWLSAFVLRCFLQARQFVSIDPTVIARTASWLSAQQEPGGTFLEPGRVIHSELQGGLDGPVSLTAYVLMALLEDATYRSMYASQVSAALSYLQTRLAQGISSNYSLSLAGYALSLADSASAPTAVNQLLSRAEEQDGVPRWSSSNVGLADSWQPRSADVEMAAYVLLALYKQGRPADGFTLMKWLSQQRNHLGGYGSTQDTIVALHALSWYSSFGSSDLLNLDILVNAPTGPVASFTINRTNYLLQQSQEIEADGELNIQVTARGRGFALFQLAAFYNVESEGFSRRRRDAHEQEAFELEIDVTDRDMYNIYLHICTRLWENQGLSQTGMAILEVGLLSGFGLADYGVPTDDVIRRVETPPGKVILYLDSITTTEMCVEIPTVLDYKVAGLQHALVTVYDYYEPRRRTSRSYTSEQRRDMSPCSLCGEDCSQCGAFEQYVPVYFSGVPPTHQCHHVIYFSICGTMPSVNNMPLNDLRAPGLGEETPVKYESLEFMAMVGGGVKVKEKRA